MRKFRIKFVCSTCNYFEWRTISEDDLEEFNTPNCSKCDNLMRMEIEDKIDLIDEFSDLAEKTSSMVEIISSSSEEGDSLYSAFNGIAGILRYPLEK